MKTHSGRNDHALDETYGPKDLAVAKVLADGPPDPVRFDILLVA